MAHNKEHRLHKAAADYADIVRRNLDPAEMRAELDAILKKLCRDGDPRVAQELIAHLAQSEEPGIDGVEAHFSLLRVLARSKQVAAAREEARRFDHPIFGYIEIAEAYPESDQSDQVHFAYSQALKMDETETCDRVNALVQIATRLKHPPALESAIRAAKQLEASSLHAAAEAYRLIAPTIVPAQAAAEYWAKAIQCAEQLEESQREERLARIVNDLHAFNGRGYEAALFRDLPESSRAHQLFIDLRPSLAPVSR